MIVGSRIKLYRMKNGLTQNELASIAGISTISIRKYESGDRVPKVETLQKIASALKISVLELVGDDWETINTSKRVSQLKKRMEDAYNEYIDEMKKLSKTDENYIDKSNKLADNYFNKSDEYSKQINSLNPPMSTGEKIKELRKSLHLSLEELSQKTKTSKILLKKIEENKRTIPYETLFRIAQLFHVDIEEISTSVANAWEPYLIDEERYYQKLVEIFNTLNEDGQKKAVEQIEILSKIPEYQEPEPDDDE
ncbi:MAG TPA: helix-turn-helix domain-containing protein [Candidatus Enterocloster excrementigallinarum]|uniref:Helix-turn-helix domain-containing protein n=1 Tax=Candidatus Enterocloster excrementigallinarum TaxID=2838558 RepID=A0A9D2TFR7_9FIRM|nr:helix-turn-helix domain-containing protein [Candidatus Enterocloster excrementigallinarum]